MPRVTKFETDLRAAFRNVDPANITLALLLINDRMSDDDLDSMPAVSELRRQCYNEPSKHHKVMTALDSLFDTCGVEHIGEVHMHDGPPIEYLNTGDSYAATVVWYRDLGKFRVQCYADAVEWCERRNIAC